MADSRGRDSQNRWAKDNIQNRSNEYNNILSLESFRFKNYITTCVIKPLVTKTL
jgi:hypothetical protein